MNNRGDPYAFCIGDIVFFRQNGKTVVPHKLAVRDRSRVHLPINVTAGKIMATTVKKRNLLGTQTTRICVQLKIGWM